MSDSTDDSYLNFIRLNDWRAALQDGFGLNFDTRDSVFVERIESGEFSTTGLLGVAQNLAGNLRRLRGYALLPASMFYYGREFQEVFGIYARDAMAKTGVDGAPLKEWDWGHMAACGARRWALGDVTHNTGIGYFQNFDDVAAFAVTRFSDFRFEEQKHGQIDAYCETLVIQAWTIFESLSEELWEAALNHHPTVLGDLGEKFKISFNDLQRLGFDVRRKLGTLFVKKKNLISFRSLEGIREAYKAAFSEQSTSIEKIIFDRELQYVAAIRNLLIHKRGVMDQEYSDQTKGIDGVPVFDPLNPDAKFPLTGEVCAKLTNCCVSTSTALVNAVHSWILGHSERRQTLISSERDCESA